MVSTNRRQIALTLTARGRAMLEKVRNEIRLQLADCVENPPGYRTKDHSTRDAGVAQGF